MSRFRTHLMALLGGALLLALSVSGALGHAPWGDSASAARNHGQMVSDYVHSLAFGDEDAAEEEPADEGDVADDTEDTDTEDTDTEDTDTEDTEDTDADEDADTEDANEDPADEDADSEESEPGAHGACVSEVAHSDEVGGPNENHGGAVSLAARETCWEDPAEEPTDGEATDGDATDEDAVDADASDARQGKDKVHGRSGDRRGGHGGQARGRSGDRG